MTSPELNAASLPAQPAAPVLADEQIMELAKAHTSFNGSHAMTNYVAFARAILLAAGAAPAPKEAGMEPSLAAAEVMQRAYEWYESSRKAEPARALEMAVLRHKTALADGASASASPAPSAQAPAPAPSGCPDCNGSGMFSQPGELGYPCATCAPAASPAGVQQLPPLPEPSYAVNNVEKRYYIADEMQEYARAALQSAGAPQAPSGVDALWVERAMDLAERHAHESWRRGAVGNMNIDTASREELRRHLSTALTAKESK